MTITEKHIKPLRKFFDPLGVTIKRSGNVLLFLNDEKRLSVAVNAGGRIESGTDLVIPADVIIREPTKFSSVVQSRLGLNKVVFARNTSVKKIPKVAAEQFFNRFHLMGSTGSAFNYGLFLNEELIAAASFSKGRKLHRLADDQRSFELIRFCSKAGITVTGGLSKLLSHFINEKKPGDIMTYVDKQFADGRSLLKLGFKKLGETAPLHYLVDKKTLLRSVFDNSQTYDKSRYVHLATDGNLKLVLVPPQAKPDSSS